MKKFNNKILVLSLFALIAIFLLTKTFRSPSRESNFNTELFKVDTSKITEIRIRPQKDTLREFRLIKGKPNWSVIREDIKANAQPYLVNNLLQSLLTLKPQRVATRKKEKWDQYQLEDSTSSEVLVLSGDEKQLRLRVGKEVSGSTYVRVNDEPEVYALQGYLQGQFDKRFTDWRNQSFLRIEKDRITKLTFQYPSDSGFVMEQKNKTWMIENEKLDSTKVAGYFNQIRSMDHDLFADRFVPDKDPDVTLILTSDSGGDVVVKGWKRSFSDWILNSTHQPEVYFLDRGPTMVHNLFIGKKKLFAGNK